MPYTQNVLYIVLIYLAVVNVVTFVMFGIDKWKARQFYYMVK